MAVCDTLPIRSLDSEAMATPALHDPVYHDCDGHYCYSMSVPKAIGDASLATTEASRSNHPAESVSSSYSLPTRQRTHFCCYQMSGTFHRMMRFEVEMFEYELTVSTLL